MNINMKNESKERGHPCRGCPYVFTSGGTDCTMAAAPGDCFWYFYMRLMGRTDVRLSAQEVRKQCGEYMDAQRRTGEKLDGAVRMLLEVAELKYGKRYAGHLRERMALEGGKT